MYVCLFAFSFLFRFFSFDLGSYGKVISCPNASLFSLVYKIESFTIRVHNQ
jgi:hypothetical protein